MGKGDVKTKRGKIWRGSHGVKRPKLKDERGKVDKVVKE
ncbi:30S ribosomal protein THX [Larkinella ripae]